MTYPLKRIMVDARGYAAAGEWARIDREVVPKIREYSPTTVVDKYLPVLFRSSNGDFRDLAGTIAAAIKFQELSPKGKDKLRNSLQKEIFSDRHLFARFRAAVALVEHHAYEDKDVPAIKRIFNSKAIQGDEDTRAIAEKYMKKLEGSE